MNQVVLFLLLFVGIILTFALANRREGFDDIADAVVEKSKKEVNPVAALCSNPPCDITEATNSIIDTSKYATSTASAISPETLKDIAMCEGKIPPGIITASICDSAFADPEFASKCGVSIAKGTTMSGTTGWMGGLYLNSYDKSAQKSNANIINGMDKNVYSPSAIGNAASPLFSTDAATCKRMAAEHTCGAGAIGTKEGDYTCALCYGDNTKHAIQTKGATSPILFTFFTNALGTGATCTLSIDGAPFMDFNKGTLPAKQVDTETNIAFYALSTDKLTVKEGANFTLTVSNPTKTAFIGGYLQSTTINSNSYRIDINSFASAANGGEDGILQNYITYVQNGGTMTLTGTIPFTFAAPSSYDTNNCKTGPFVSLAQSATELGAGGGCYAPDAAPGNYGVQCLQTTFTAVGGSKKGNGYPQSEADATNIQTLLFDAKGTPRTLNGIVAYLSGLSAQASTGMLNGKSLSMYDWNQVSLYMTGIAVADPCDSPKPGFKGPYSQECYNYLYSTSSTYIPKGLSSQKSLASDGITPLTCRPEGTLNPATPEGLAKAQAIAATQGKQGVINLYINSFNSANDASKPTTDPARAEALRECYGITSVQKPNPEVYQVGGYSYSQADAPGVCAKLGGVLATPEQVKASHRAGAQACSCGRTTDPKMVIYPMQSGFAGCGSSKYDNNCYGGTFLGSGTQPGIKPDQLGAGVWCYGPKPTQSSEVVAKTYILPFSSGVKKYNSLDNTPDLWNQPHVN